MTGVDALRDELRKAARDLGAPAEVEPALERPRDPAFGDWATNFAMVLARPLKRKPREVAQALIDLMDLRRGAVKSAEIAGPGFINFRIDEGQQARGLAAILDANERYGRAASGAGQPVNVEFVSANPTGPLHVGHGRQAALGDAISSLLAWIGWDVSREFYYNDAGAQIENLAVSTWLRVAEQLGEPVTMPKFGYHGDYIRDIAQRFLEEPGADASAGALRGGARTVSGAAAEIAALGADDGAGESADADEDEDAGDQKRTREREVAAIRSRAIAALDRPLFERIRAFAVQELRKEQDLDLQAFGVRFDTYYLESSLYTDGLVDEVVAMLGERGMTYEKDGALWLRTTSFGDDKDRVMRKRDGSYTYFVPDVAYHVTKWRRGFRRAINVQGADHHSTVTRVRAGLQALGVGIPEGYPEYALHQMVTVMRGGEEVKISKRAGSYVTVRDLVDEVGRDAVRYFFLMRKGHSQLSFDVELAKKQSDENPVYYVQMAHARVCGIFRVGEIDRERYTADGVELEALAEAEEQELIKALLDFPAVVAGAAESLEPHRLVSYLWETARLTHLWYHKHHVLGEPERISRARLALARAAQIVLRNGLTILGISAPERM